jgi:hypothetical protein
MKIKLMRIFSYCKRMLVIIICILYCYKAVNQGVSISVANIPADKSAILDISSSTQGMLIPRLTRDQRDAIYSPTESLLIYNKTTQCYEVCIDSVWNIVSCPLTTCYPPSVPGIISGNISLCSNTSGVIYSINPVNFAKTYTWSVPSDATIQPSDTTSNTSITVTFGRKSGYISVIASNTCGTSIASTLSVTVNSAEDISITSLTATEQSGVVFNVRPVNGINGNIPYGTTYIWNSPSIDPTNDAIIGGTAQNTGVTYIYGILTNTGTGAPSPAAWAVYSVTPTSAAGCKGTPFTVTDTVLKVGSIYNEGVVGYFLTSGQSNGINFYDQNLSHAHGLIFAPTYNAQGVTFCSSNIFCSLGTSNCPDGIGKGLGNTASFIANYGTVNASAPATCYNYGSNPGVWWLPTSAELLEIQPNWALIGGFNTSTCSNKEYWSSTGWFNTGACGNGGCDAHNVSLPMGCGDGYGCGSASYNVRCMRNF